MSNHEYRVADLGVYVLPGRATDTRLGVTQAVAAEQAGLGSVWLAERWERKELGTICGAMAQATSRIRIVAGMTHFATRHPIVLAGLGATMQSLSAGRFAIGVARSSPELWANLGLPPMNNAGLADHADVLRRLWAGETLDHDGPAGRFPKLRMPEAEANPPPLLLAAIGPKSLELAGRHFDGAVLHPFLTQEGVARSAAIARRAAAAAGRDPAKFRVAAAVVVAPDLSPEERLLTVEARAITYFSIPDVGSLLLKMNGWDPEPVQRLLADPKLRSLEFQQIAHAEFVERISKAAALLPASWGTDGAATGTAAECAQRLRGYLDAGVDEIVLHGTPASKLHRVLQLYSGAETG